MAHDVFILASGSPRREELLRLIGLSFECRPGHIDERPFPGECAQHYVLRLCQEKAMEIAGRSPQRWVIAADTAVALDGEILGKPRDLEEARRILERLQGRSHEVYTGLCVVRMMDKKHATEVVRTEVSFRTLTSAQIDWYLRTGEPLDKAGGYGIQGLGAVLVRRIDGSYSNVVGLPLAELVDMLRTLGAWDLFGAS